MTVKLTNKDFGYSVKFLKKNGYTFDSSTKTWSGSKDVSFLLDDGYAVAVNPVVNDLSSDMDQDSSIK